MSTTLNGVIARYEITVGPVVTRPTTPASLPIPEIRPDTLGAREILTKTAPNLTHNPSQTSTITRRRPVPSLSEYLSKREKEDARGGEIGLLSLGSTGPRRADSGLSKSQRDQLLAGQTSDGVMGNSQLHEELGGQLAEVSISG